MKYRIAALVVLCTTLCRAEPLAACDRENLQERITILQEDVREMQKHDTGTGGYRAKIVEDEAKIKEYQRELRQR